MRSLLIRASSLDLLAIAAIGGQAVSDRVDDELDRRAAAAIVRRVLRTAAGTAGRRFLARRRARPVVAA